MDYDYHDTLNIGAGFFGFLAAAFAVLALNLLLWDWPKWHGLAAITGDVGVFLLVWGYAWDWLYTSCIKGDENDAC